MGKKSGSGSGSGSSSSWISLVKKAFRSPVKDSNEKRNGRRREDPVQEDEEIRKREKRRWLFRKSSATEAKAPAKAESTCVTVDPMIVNEQRHAIAVAAATAAAAEAAVATAQAAMEIARLSRPPQPQPPPPTSLAKENWAAVVIQTAFRGYLARRALRALKGLVKLQALVRGHNVRKQAKLTLQCMQALVRVQDRMRDQRARLSHEGNRKSMFAESSNLWESSYLQDIRERKSMSRNTSSCTADFWDQQQLSEMMDMESLFQSRRERTLSQAFSQQMWGSRRNPSIGDDKDLEEEKVKWLDRWMATKQWENESRASTDKKLDAAIKTVEIDTSRPYSSHSALRNPRRASVHQNFQYGSKMGSQASPMHRAHQNLPLHHHSPVTPSPSKTRPIQVRSASPRCSYRDDKCYSAATTPSLASSTSYWANRAGLGGPGASSMNIPNYMAATESAKARSRSQSAPRQRPATPERDRAGSVKKRLSYPVPDPSLCGYGPGQNLRSPSFKSAHCGQYFGMEQRSNLSSYTESFGGEISPCSTTDLRWFR